MQIGQNLLLQMGGSSNSKESLNAVLQGTQDEAQSFAQLLEMQDPAQLEGLLQQLGIADPAAALAELRQLQIDGKLLPPGSEDGNPLTLQAEDSEIAATLADSSVEGVAAVAAEWLHWLNQARLGQPDGQSIDTEDSTEPDSSLLESSIDSSDDSQIVLPGINASTQPAANTEAGKESLAQLAAGSSTDAQRQNSLPANAGQNTSDSQRQQTAAGNIASTSSDNSLNLNSNDNQRTQNNNPLRQNADLSLLASRADFSDRLAEASERPAARSNASDREAIESAIKSLTQATSSAQSALSARPVQAPPMTLGVPFGQTGYAESLVEKVMWMSSQNLRSAEIRLDPADLGPLEIHIQSRGQEHQVQFVSLNPSVREALEAQAFRLREMFAQQGLDLQNVSVSDQSANQQGREQQAMADGSGERSGRGNREVHGGHEGDDPQDTRGSSQPLAQLISNRLIDYYA